MSSGFVSGGSLEKPIERDDEWKKAQQELEENRKKKAELEKQREGKSLFEVLQTNKGCYPLDPHTTLFHLGWYARFCIKAAKQDAFEEVM